MKAPDLAWLMVSDCPAFLDELVRITDKRELERLRRIFAKMKLKHELDDTAEAWGLAVMVVDERLASIAAGVS